MSVNSASLSGTEPVKQKGIPALIVGKMQQFN
jgi:hypothetical protein